MAPGRSLFGLRANVRLRVAKSRERDSRTVAFEHPIDHDLQTLDELERQYIKAREEAWRRGEREETTDERRALYAILKHKCSGHDGRPWPAA